MINYFGKINSVYNQYRRVFVVLSLVTVPVCLFGLYQFTHIDYLAKYRLKQDTENQDTYNISMKNIVFRQYDISRPLTKIEVDEVLMNQNQDIMKLRGVKEGVFLGSYPISFAADYCEYHVSEGKIITKNHSRIFDKNMDLKTSGFDYSRDSGMLNISSPLYGKLYDGYLSAKFLKYCTIDESFTLGPVSWTGEVKEFEKNQDVTSSNDKKYLSEKEINSTKQHLSSLGAEKRNHPLIAKFLLDKQNISLNQFMRLISSGIACRNQSRDSNKNGDTKSEGIQSSTDLHRQPSVQSDKSIQASEQKQIWKIKADGVSRLPGSKVEIWNNAIATDNDVVIQAERLERDVDKDVMFATGNVKYANKDMVMLCKKATIFRNKKRAVLEDDVQIYVFEEKAEEDDINQLKPVDPELPEHLMDGKSNSSAKGSSFQKSSKNYDQEVKSKDSLRKYPIVIWVKKIDYSYEEGSRKGYLSGGIIAKQELNGGRWRQLTSDSAIYDRESDRLKLTSNDNRARVRMHTSLGDDIRASLIDISTKDNDDSWSAQQIVGEVYIDSDDLPQINHNSLAK